MAIKKIEERIGNLPEGETVLTWRFRCNYCSFFRMAYCATNGMVLDIKEGDNPDDIPGVVTVEDGVARNVYLIPELKDTTTRNTEAGRAHLKVLIAQNHGLHFHGQVPRRMEKLQ